ncbi:MULTISPECIES: polysaccharide deacetylase family protein [unclassified Agarivorans]|uniref:polysaccharide deacetylase family protein n=1 Tax=unclassified Agarivorans TaxID=2636026 RepID=UPI0026E18172|nr:MULTISPECIES: polysaccharide deacetylase family protein [unclassified Agarivorans]MDO6685706.1 polysaccharide deacetylase family protein [Agarivorans sp. 3_MG-2023]MDO6716179.1 polysaccharide deacetylase family protein [Agarivorans sp. 2_MG-2023]
MNILMALSQLEVTGAEVYATQVGDRLTQRGHQVFYVSDTLSCPHQGQHFRLRFNKRSLPRRVWHVFYLIYLILRYKIQLVHAHSRASGWSSYIACKLTNTPMITSVHGRQPVHRSRKKFHALGYHAVAVCENIAQQIIRDLGVPEQQVSVVRNGVDSQAFHPLPATNNLKPVIQIIGRLTGPKGELVYQLLKQAIDLDANQVQVISGSKTEARFAEFEDKVEFCGYSQDIRQTISQADLVIGAGRVAMEALLCQKPVFAVGEAKALGFITLDNLPAALASNFGDVADDGKTELDIDYQQLAKQLLDLPQNTAVSEQLVTAIKAEYDLDEVSKKLLDIYQSAYVYTKQREVPIIMYHRVIDDPTQHGAYGTYVTAQRLEEHFQTIKWMGLTPITFSELANIGLEHRFNHGKRYIILTFDDGYQDNYDLLLPLLKKYQFKAVIYAVSGTDHNQWDVSHPTKPDQRFELMNAETMRKIDQSGYVEIGGHTVTHPKLAELTEAEQQQEIEQNKAELESLLDRKLNTFAYPYGNHNQQTKQVAKQAGYTYTVATDSGPIGMHQDLQQIRRIVMFPSTTKFGLWRKIKGNYTYKKKIKADS